MVAQVVSRTVPSGVGQLALAGRICANMELFGVLQDILNIWVILRYLKYLGSDCPGGLAGQWEAGQGR